MTAMRSHPETDRRALGDRRIFDDPAYSGPERRKRRRRRLSDDVEVFFINLGGLLCRNAKKALAVTLLFIAMMAWHIPRITVDTSSEALLHPDDAILQAYNRFRDQFGRSELIILGIVPRDVFDPAFLDWLDGFHKDLQNTVPFVKDVSSLMNARHTRVEGDTLRVGPLLANWPEKHIDLSVLSKDVLQNPFYVDHVISSNGRMAAVVIETQAHISETDVGEDVLAGFDSEAGGEEQSDERQHYFGEKENRQVVQAIRAVVERHGVQGIDVHCSGGPVILEAFNRYTMLDLLRCVSLSILVVIVFLGLLFRRLTGVVLPLLVIIASVLTTMGLMAIFGVSIKMTTTVLPAFLVAVGVGDSVHLLAIFFRRLQQVDDKAAAIIYALGHSGMAIVMTTLTTAAGLLSFSFAELSAIADLGVFAAAGVVFALIYTLIMLPAVLVLLPVRSRPSADRRSRKMDRFLMVFADLSAAHPMKILGLSAVVAALAVYGLFALRYSEYVVDYFPDRVNVKHDLKRIDREMNGVITLEVVVDTQQKNGVMSPALLNTIEDFVRRLQSLDHPGIQVGKVFSINDIVKEINQALHENDGADYRIPQTRQLIAQELLLFENTGADDLERIVDSDFSKTRITVKTPWVDSVIFESFVQRIQGLSREVFAAHAASEVTGAMALMARTIPAALRSMTRSYIIAFVVITVMMVILVENIKLGLISMIPNLLPIVVIMGMMGMAKVPLDMTSLMIGSIALGLVVDDTVHFMFNFKRYYDRCGDSRTAIQETLLGTGRAMLITTLVLSCGFFSDLFATLVHIQRFGFFTGITILLALLADFLVAPALMMCLYRGPSK